MSHRGGVAKGALALPDAAQVAEVLLWLLVVAVPLVVVPTARHAFELPKQLLGGGIALASLLAIAYGAARGAGLGLGAAGLAAAWRRPAVRAVLPLAAAALLSIAFGPHREHGLAALPALLVACAAVVGWALALPSARLARPLAGLLAPAALLSLLAILQYHDLFRPFAFLGGEEVARLGVSSLAGNAGHLAAWLAFACVVTQAGLALRPTGWRRAAVAAGLAVAVYALVVTQTLAAVAALAAGSAAVWWVRLPRRRALAGLAAVVVLGALLVVTVGPLRQRVGSAVAALQRGEVNRMLTGRLDAWRSALWMCGERPLTGVGHGAYVAEYSDAKLALLDEGVPFYRRHRQPTFSEAHSEPLQVAAEWGLLGVAALAWALWVVLAAAWRVGGKGGGRDDAKRRREAALAWGGLAALAVLSLVHFPFRLALTGFPALLFLAWLLRRSDELGAAQGDGEPAAGGRGGRLAAWGLTVLLAAALVGWVFHARDLLHASRIQKAVEEVSRQLVARGGAPSQILWANLRLLRQAEELAPAEAGLPLAAGAQYLLLRRPDEAIEQYRRALALEPRPEAWLNLGRAQWSAGDREAAVESFAVAARLHPRLRRELPTDARRRVMAAIPEAER